MLLFPFQNQVAELAAEPQETTLGMPPISKPCAPQALHGTAFQPLSLRAQYSNVLHAGAHVIEQTLLGEAFSSS